MNEFEKQWFEIAREEDRHKDHPEQPLPPMTKLGFWKGRPIEDLSHEQLLQAFQELGALYVARLTEQQRDHHLLTP